MSMRHLDPIHAIDFYKSGHIYQFPEGSELVFSNGTPRSNKLFNSHLPKNGVVVWGIQGFMTWFHELFDEAFFQRPKAKVLKKYARRMNKVLGPGRVGTEHIEALHDLGYLPIEVRALPEGTMCPYGVPVYVMFNTLPEFYWLTNYLETVFSSEIWKPMTNATIALHYKALMVKAALATGVSPDHWFIDYQGHDFSFRGMSGWHDAASSGSGHLVFFKGTDTNPALDFVEEYYGADIDEDYVVAGSVAATEHAVMCMGTKDGEFETFRRLVQDVYPDGIVSIVSDAWDYWQVIDDYLPRLKDIIMARNGKVVIRPDSGDPVHIVGGYRIEGFKDRATLNISGVSSSTEVIHIEETNTYHLITGEGTINSLMADDRNIISRSEAVGSIQRLWEIFGGTQTETGHFLLDEHIGLIYGDSITLAREDQIFSRLAGRNFASINVVFGIGSYTYQMNTRDSTGTAVKATAGKVNGEFREIFKEPKTDKGGTKKSARGFLKVIKDSQGKLVLVDGITFDQVQDADNQHQLVYRDGKFFNTQTLEDARVRAAPLVVELASQI
ncbi:putative nicotinamide [Shigella phage ChubbyThor]|nr:putative nicotinamide [Shigella phage ChubbyThor]